jgi:prepilin-type N-terminal cleavage/methylation domain-containing protein
MYPAFRREAFTLIELLIVIAIIAILAVVVVLTLNPVQLLSQSRDASRLSDMAGITSAINLYITDQAGAATYSLGNPSNVYLSLPDTSITGSATSSLCAGTGVATSSGSYSHFCVSPSNYRLPSGAGWIPVAFSKISAGSPFGSLPVDPVNRSSTNLYYTYVTNGSQYELSAFLESQKYAKIMPTTGGTDPAIYKTGSGAATILSDLGRGLVGYWPLNEGVGGTIIDWSGNNNNATWIGTPAGTNGYYSVGKTAAWAGAFNGIDDYIRVPAFSGQLASGKGMTIAGWVYPANNPAVHMTYFGIRSMYDGDFYILQLAGTNNLEVRFLNSVGETYQLTQSTVTPSKWNFVAMTYDGATLSFYLNGALDGSTPASGWITSTVLPFCIGGIDDIGVCNPGGYNLSGYLNDIRAYNRALSAAEVQEIYNAEK